MIRVLNYVMLSALFLLCAGAYSVSDSTRRTQAHIVALHQEIAEEEERLQVLLADWEYLNGPRQLEGWARQLALAPVEPAQIVRFDDLPSPFGVEARPALIAGVGGPEQADFKEEGIPFADVPLPVAKEEIIGASPFPGALAAPSGFALPRQKPRFRLGGPAR